MSNGFTNVKNSENISSTSDKSNKTPFSSIGDVIMELNTKSAMFSPLVSGLNSSVPISAEDIYNQADILSKGKLSEVFVKNLDANNQDYNIPSDELSFENALTSARKDAESTEKKLDKMIKRNRKMINS